MAVDESRKEEVDQGLNNLKGSGNPGKNATPRKVPAVHEPSKEIVIHLNKSHLMKGIYISIIVVLVTIIILQQTGVISTSGSSVAESTKEVEEAAEEKSGAVVEVENQTEEDEKPPAEEVKEAEVNKTVEEVEEEVALLPITGDINVTIKRVAFIKKAEDYARVNYVEFTITNQDVDFTPKVTVYLEAYGSDDAKDVTYEEIKAGETFSKLENKFTFGYNNIADEQEIILEVFNEKNKVVAKTTKKFTTI